MNRLPEAGLVMTLIDRFYDPLIARGVTRKAHELASRPTIGNPQARENDARLCDEDDQMTAEAA